MEKGTVASVFLVWAVAGNGMAVVGGHTHPHPGPVASEMKGLMVSQETLDKLEVGFLMEVEGVAAKSGAVRESDITLATVELTLDAGIVEGVSGHLGLLWEEDDTETQNVDEGHVTFGATGEIPFYATAGKMYLPFGNLKSVFISDPLTLELAEINQSAALLGYGNNWVDLNVGAFNGDFEEDADDNTLDDAFAFIALTPFEGWVVGAYWLSDLLETDGCEDFVNGAVAAGYAYDAAPGAGVFLNAQTGPVALNAEYVTALQKPDLPTGRLRPAAYNIEASMPVVDRLSAGIKWEGSDDFYSDFATEPEGKWADWQAGFVVSFYLNEHVTLSGEYLHADGLEDNESGDMATMQIAMEL